MRNPGHSKPNRTGNNSVQRKTRAKIRAVSQIKTVASAKTHVAHGKTVEAIAIHVITVDRTRISRSTDVAISLLAAMASRTGPCKTSACQCSRPTLPLMEMAQTHLTVLKTTCSASRLP